MGLQDIVKVVEHDFTSSTVFSVLPEQGTVDIITMSYSFSMIPDQKSAIANATKLIKSGGHIALADFFLKGKYDDCLPSMSRRFRNWESLFHKNWFAMDHVHLLDDAQLESVAGPELDTVWDNRFRGGVPFLPFLQPYHGVYFFQKK